MLQKPFLKWAGGKYRLLDKILPELPAGDRLVEPFAGSASVFLNAPSFKEALVCDINPDLMGLYAVLQREGESFIQHCRSFFTPENNTPEAYYRLRDAFNRSPEPGERAALLLYLNRHGYNGLVRYNAKGIFNVPFGRYKKPYFPKAEMRGFFCRARAGARFLATDFREVFERLRPGDVVYCDPPYTPLSRTSDFTAYAAGGFGEKEQRELARVARKAADRGITVVISNHDTEETRKMYAGARLVSFDARRSISCRTRGCVAELLAVFG